MWPFNKKQRSVSQNNLRYTQVDITEHFGDNLNLGPEEWIETKSIYLDFPNPEASGLPSKDASPEKIYEIASTLSSLREEIVIPTDGVYCPICHIANTQLQRLHSPCPKCGRELLKFGWD